MYGPVLSVLLMGMLPLWGASGQVPDPLAQLQVAPPAPVLVFQKDVSPLHLAASLSASGAVIVDVGSGQRLFGKNDVTPRPMASLTKLMTALLIVEHHNLEELVTVPGDVESINGDSIALPPGHQFPVGSLLSALLISSSNDAAVALARFHSGTMQAFVEEMNIRARELGLRNTSYANPMGLDALSNYSTPRDLAWLVLYAMRHDALRERLGTRGAHIQSIQGERIYLTHTHALLHADTRIVAGKTGTTSEAGQCLLSLVDDGKRQYLIILLNSSDRYADVQAILEALAV